MALEHYTRAMDTARAEVQRAITANEPGSDIAATTLAADGPLAAQRTLAFVRSSPAALAYVERFAPDPAERARLLGTMAEAANSPNIRGIADWVQFSMAAKKADQPARVLANLRDDVAELRVALGLVARDPTLRVTVASVTLAYCPCVW